MGLVASFNRPGGNVTGVTFNVEGLATKQLGLVHELFPKAETIAVLLDPNIAATEAQMRGVEEAGRAIRRKILIVHATSGREFNGAFATIVKAGAGALLVGGGALFLTQRRQLVTLAARHALPTCYVSREYAEAGGLMSYGSSQTEAYRRAGSYAARILRGANPADLPIELTTKYELMINLATAKALDIDIPPTLLSLADEVIE